MLVRTCSMSVRAPHAQFERQDESACLNVKRATLRPDDGVSAM